MIKFLDLYSINQRFESELKKTFSKSLERSYFILGENVSQFENEFATYCGSKYCLGTANGLDALTLILKAYIQIGKLKKGDKVIVPANTFIATIFSVIHAELKPVLIEPNPETYNLCLESVKANINKDVKAIIMVHMYGQLADVEQFKYIAKTNNILLIEDAAQAHGAKLKSLKFQSLSISNQKSTMFKAGNLSDAAAFSFYPSKNLGALGDGGAITTNNLDVYNAVKLLRNYGSSQKYNSDIIGYNSRLDDIQAAFLSIKLRFLDADNTKRQYIANKYLKGVNNTKLKLPFYNGSNNHVFYAFVIQVEDRDTFSKYLNDNKIGWLIHYPIAPHHQKALETFSNLQLPITEYIHKHIISIPISPVMTNKQIEKVIKVLNNY